MPYTTLNEPYTNRSSTALSVLTYVVMVVLGCTLFTQEVIVSAFIVPSALIAVYAAAFRRWRAEMLIVWPLAFGFFLYGATLMYTLSGLLAILIIVLGLVIRGIRLIDFSYNLEVFRKWNQ